ncbi:MAG: restriction endonuclease, partial [Muribaculum sp.]|nr:restriction endonuclease [Muribaculum sp.]
IERCSLDFRAKGNRRERSAHATMLEYLNSTENIYGIVANGPTLRLIRNSGQLVKQTYIEFDLRRMFEEDKYAEFCLMFRTLHASRFTSEGDNQSIIEKYFNLSIESGNRIRAGLSQAAQRAMEIIGNAAIKGNGEGNEILRSKIESGAVNGEDLNKQLIHLIYRLLFLFIIEDRGLVYDGDTPGIRRCKEIYKKYYAVSRYRDLSELAHVRSTRYSDLWRGLMDSFRLFEDGDFGSQLGIKPLGGVLFSPDTLSLLKDCEISNTDVFDAFNALNRFRDESGQMVKINYSSLDVEEFGSVYEGILEKRPELTVGGDISGWEFGYVGGLDRQSTSSYYTRPDLVQSLIRTTLEPVIKERIARYSTPEEKVASLLSMKVCDAASGSGHIVLAMARTIAWYVSSIRSGEDNPASMEYRRALHEVIQKCVYAVDYNPDAVELCKVVLWIEGYCAGMPLSFLDHHIHCGNSVVGVTDLDTLLQGVPDKAFSATDKETLKKIKGLNKKAVTDAQKLREKTSENWVAKSLFGGEFNITRIDEEQISLAESVREINALPENSLLEQLTKKSRWEELMESPRVECLRRACDIFVDAFYYVFKEEDVTATAESCGTVLPGVPYTATVYQALEEIKQLDSPDTNYVPLTQKFKEQVAKEAANQRFFHWCVEFPEVFADGGGFDVMCGNPPWDKLQMEDEKWFEGKDNSIVDAPNQAARNKKIEALKRTNPALYVQYQEARHYITSQSKYVKESGRFTLTNNGKIELSSLFAEICLNFSREAWGLVLPTGIAVNDSNKAFFAKLIDENRLISLFDFENREKLFDIDSRFKFCLLTAGKAFDKERQVKGGFYLTRLDHLLDPNRIYTLRTSDFALLNPNTKTCPTFRTSRDAELTRKFYLNAPIMVDEIKGINHWGIKFATLFNMATDSYLFRTRQQLLEQGAEKIGNFFMLNGERYVPLYEGKMIWLHNHQYGEFPKEGNRPSSINSTTLNTLKNTSSDLSPWYWVPEDSVIPKMSKEDKDGNVIWSWPYHFYTSFRDVTNATNERTCVASLVPGLCPVAIMASIPFDYVARQKVGGSSMGFFILKQMPIPAPEDIPEDTKWEMAKRVIELTYFNHDMDAWAEELWEEMTDEQRAEMPQVGLKEPFIFDPDRRAVLQAELDAIVAHLFGLSTDDLRYILDPEDVCGPGCINETFRVLKERELRELGEYRTRRLVLDAWHRFNYHN